MIKLISEMEKELENSNNDLDYLYEKVLIKSKDFPLPSYHTAIYPNLYTEQKWFNFFSKSWVNNILSCWTREKIIDSFLEEIPSFSKIEFIWLFTVSVLMNNASAICAFV